MKLLRGDGELIFAAAASEGTIGALREVGARDRVAWRKRSGRSGRTMRKLAEFEINEVLVEAVAIEWRAYSRRAGR